MGETSQTMKRVAVLATLGAEVVRLNIGYEHRDAWRGVLEMSLEEFRASTAQTERGDISTIGKALAWLVTSDLGPLAEFGTAVLHQRRAEAYAADCASWEATPPSVKAGAWRRKTPTRQQRMLMIRISDALNLSLPDDLSRGEAAEWIDRNGRTLTTRRSNDYERIRYHRRTVPRKQRPGTD
jgi:hypothetical protein